MTETTAGLQRLETGRLGERAKEALLQSIRSGGFPGGTLPSEERLAEELGVSRTTVREALRSLEEVGVITRQRGIGTRVNEHVLRVTALNRAAGFIHLIRESGAVAEIAWTKVRHEESPPDVVERLGEAGSGEALLIERLFLADGLPVIHLVEHVPLAAIAQPVDETAIPDSIFELSDRYCRIPIDHTIVDIVPVLADREIAQQLGVAEGAPLLQLLETHHAADGSPLLVSRIHAVDRLLRFSVVRKRM